MRIVFFGTPEFAVPSLETLLRRGESVVAVVTQPERPRGRSRSSPMPPAIAVAARAAGLAVMQPERPAGPDFESALRALAPDLGVVVAYGHILRPAVLEVPARGMINVHASLLPRLRGAAPVPWAILRGDAQTGVTIMQMDPGLDSGPILHQVPTPIGPDETRGELTARLATLGAEALAAVLDRLARGPVEATAQDQGGVTLAPKVDRAAARIDWSEPAAQVARRIRAFDPAPGAWTQLLGVDLKCFRPRLVSAAGPPGTVLDARDGLVVAAGDGAVRIGEVQPAGRARMTAADWLRGHPLSAGAKLT